jgi:ABC-type glutathione transport system ATPase component
MIIATHDLALASRINGRHVVLHNGEVQQDESLVTAPHTPRRATPSR